jgi:hypothetical protein
LSNIGRQYIPAWPKLALPSLRRAVYESDDPSPHIESKRAGIQMLKKENMKGKSMIRMVVAFCLALALSVVAQSQAQKSLRDKENKVIAPVAVRALPITLGRYSSRKVVE